MKITKKMLSLLLCGAMFLSLAGCGEKECDHEWLDATCDEPKTCEECDETKGKALGHTWTEATCETPKTCSVCNEAEGEILGHTWTEADCTNPKTCEVCKTTEGSSTGHINSKIEYGLVDFNTATRVFTKICKDCEENIEQSTEILTTFVDNDCFLFTAIEFCERFNYIVDSSYLDYSFVASVKKLENDLIIIIEDTFGYEVANIMFISDMDVTIGYNNRNDRTISYMAMVTPLDDDKAYLSSYYRGYYYSQAAILVALTVDPQLTDTSANDVVAQSVNELEKPYFKNGICYILSCPDDDTLYYVLGIINNNSQLT